MSRFALSIFTSAFLLFLIQPIIARYILPWYGGSTAVWSVCMMFFQFTLLAGYAYAHFLNLHLSPRQQACVHSILVLIAVMLLPIVPEQPGDIVQPVMSILVLLGISVGLPYFLVSASAPLLQSWFHISHPASSAYRLYALSNTGSILALLCYPFLIEPHSSLHSQSNYWSLGFITYALLMLYCARKVWDHDFDKQLKRTENTGAQEKVDKTTRVLWLLLPACASLLLLATTNQLCQDLSVVPFLWLMPLALYLLSFIVCFHSEQGYERRLWLPIFIASAVLGIYASFLSSKSNIFFQVATYSSVLFSACMLCHGEMVKIKPVAEKLTSFYLHIATGGALGGLFVTLIAPLIFDGYWELQLGWCITFIVGGFCMFRKNAEPPAGTLKWAAGTWALVSVAFIALLVFHIHSWKENVIEVTRDFYGILKIREYPPKPGHPVRERSLTHGSILHGSQIVNNEQSRKIPTTYFSKYSGIGLGIDGYPRDNQQGIHIGIIGMGVGTIAALCEKGDKIRFYELNPGVVEIAKNHFSFLEDTGASWQVVIGDARVSLENELENSQFQQFDILVVDAFSSDAIPVHLLTREAFDVYNQHLKTDGILALHITNRHLDLRPVIQAAARQYQLEMIEVNSPTNDRLLMNRARWMLLTRNTEFLEKQEVSERGFRYGQFQENLIEWTDDYSNLFGILKL